MCCCILQWIATLVTLPHGNLKFHGQILLLNLGPEVNPKLCFVHSCFFAKDGKALLQTARVSFVTLQLGLSMKSTWHLFPLNILLVQKALLSCMTQGEKNACYRNIYCPGSLQSWKAFMPPISGLEQYFKCATSCGIHRPNKNYASFLFVRDSKCIINLSFTLEDMFWHALSH